MLTNLENRNRNVIEFPRQRRRRQLTMSCTEALHTKVCSHCGGRLAEDESEDDCSSARRSRSL